MGPRSEAFDGAVLQQMMERAVVESFEGLQACNDELLQTGEDLWMQVQLVFRSSDRGISAVHCQHLLKNPLCDMADTVSKINKSLTDIEQEVLKRAAHALQVEVRFQYLCDADATTRELMGHKVLLSCGQ